MEKPNKLIMSIILIIVGFIVVFNVIGAVAPDMSASAGIIAGNSTPNGINNQTGSGLPLSNLFASNGVVLLIFMVGVLIALVALAMKSGLVHRK